MDEYKYKINYSYAHPAFYYTKHDADRAARRIARKARVMTRVTRLSDGEIVSMYNPTYHMPSKQYRLEKLV